MTPKEKATKLIGIYEIAITHFGRDEQRRLKEAIQCAKISVDEIENEIIHLQEEKEGVYGTRELFERHSYWQEVKQELEKL